MRGGNLLSNSIIFYVLSLIAMIIFIITLRSKRKPYLIAVFFMMAGLAFVLEYFVLILGDGYVYYPQFISHDFYDSLLGSLVSQAIVIPVAATVVAAYNLRLKSMILISVLFMGIETMFIYLNLYEQKWWKTIYTGLLLPFYFLFAKKWLYLLQQRNRKWVQYVSLYFMTLSFNSVILFFLVLIFKTHQLEIGWFEEAARDHIAINTIYIIVLTAIFTIIIFKEIRWYWTSIILLMFFLLDHLLIHLGILMLANWWSVFYFTLLNLLDLMIIYFINQYICFKYYSYR
jgi:hypothetical protein